MAEQFVMSLPATMFMGDDNTIVAAGDLPAIPDNINGRSAMRFIDGADESAAVSHSFSIPDSNIWTSGSGAAIKVYYFGDAAGGGNTVDLEVAFECITEADAVDMHASGDAFAAVQSVVDTVDATAGQLNVATITFTQAQADAIEPGDACRIVLRRDSDDGTNDTYTDSIWVVHVDLYEDTA